jgi:hypothetical protein
MFTLTAPQINQYHRGKDPCRNHPIPVALKETVLVCTHIPQEKGLDVLKRFLMIGAIAASISVGGYVDVGAASADPAVCGGPGTPPCAPGLSPEQQCALVAWRTWTPCNWLGVQVPIGTPGSG